MLEGQRQAAHDLHYASGYALVAERRGDIEEAIRRWSLVRRKFPGSWMGYVHGAVCQCRAGQNELAEQLNKQAIRKFRGEVEVWVASARTAEHRCDWPAAIRRWESVRNMLQHVPSHHLLTSYIGIAHGLEESGRIGEAEQLLKESQARWPIVPEIAIALARLANSRGDNEETVRLWADARRRFPLSAFGYREGFQHLAGLGRHEDAEAILLAAIDRFPEAAWPTLEYARLAHARRDWAAAAARWAAVRAGWPDRQDGYLRGADACAALGRLDEAAQLRWKASADSRTPPPDPIAEEREV